MGIFLDGKRPRDLRRVVLGSVFEDVGPYSHSAGMDCILFGSLVAMGDERRCKYLVALTVKEQGGDAIGSGIWRDIMDGFEDLARNGLLDADGRKWFILPIYAKADEDERANGWGSPEP